MASRIRIRRGTTTQWDASTKILESGELGLDTTLNKLKVGNGSSLWSVLPYINVLPSELTELAQDAVELAITAGTGITKNYNDTANTITLAVDDTIANKTYVDTAVSGLSSTSQTTYIPLSLLGNVDGVAELDGNGFIPDSQIPAGITRDTELSSAITTEVTDRNTAITSAITNLINGSPAALNTLKELSDALGADANFAATVTSALGSKLNTATAVSDYLKIADAASTYLTSSSATTNYLQKTQPALDYQITNSGTGGYLINGVLNGPITLTPGKLHRIYIQAPGHPFWFQTSYGAYNQANVYETGIEGSGTATGQIVILLPLDAPQLYYACQFHEPMKGVVLFEKDNSLQEFTAKTGSYTPVLTDMGKIIEMSGGGTFTITDSASFPVGTTFEVLQTGTSQVTIAGNGFTPNSTPGLKLRTQWSSATVIKRSLNSWVVLGDLSA
jgi:hypothetical protein